MALLSRIAPEIPVLDLRHSIEHYEQKLGFRLVMQMPDGGYAIVERDAISIHLFQDLAREHSPVGMHIFTQGLEELHAELQRSGARMVQGIIRKPWGSRDFRVADLSGNELKFTEPLSDNE